MKIYKNKLKSTAKKLCCSILAAAMVITGFPQVLHNMYDNTIYADNLEKSSDLKVTFKGTYQQSSARSMLSMINDFRTGSQAWAWNSSDTQKIYYNGLETLTYDYELEKVAMQRAVELVALYEHTRPNGSSCFTAYTDTYTNTYMGENIAIGTSNLDAESAFELWREDEEPYSGQGHRRNMLNSSYKSVGIAHVYYRGCHYWVQEFSSKIGSQIYTNPNDSETDMTVSIASEFIKNVTLEAEYESKELLLNESSVLPKVHNIIKTSTWNYAPSIIYEVSPKWSVSSGTSVLSISDNNFTGISKGEAVLTGTYDNKTIDINVSVKNNLPLDISWYINNESEKTFNISTPQQLAGLAALVNEGETFEGKTINLINDIYLNPSSDMQDDKMFEWIPIAYYEKDENNTDSENNLFAKNYFNGTFNGNNHHIYNMFVRHDGKTGGLFGVIGKTGIVKAVNVSGNSRNSGCIAAYNEGIIAFCNNYAKVGYWGEISAVGGICNYNYNLVYGCKNYGEVNALSNALSSFTEIGGIVGRNAKNTATISECSNHGHVGGREYVGGISGWNLGWVYNCYNSGEIANFYLSDAGRYISGIACQNANKGRVINCYFNGNVLYVKPNTFTMISPISDDYNSENNSNCYAIESDKYDTGAEILQAEDMKTDSFVNKLDNQTHSVFPVWKKDIYNLNNGFPITTADYNYYKGIYKIMPELWHAKDISADISDKEYKFSYISYYNEENPVLTIDNSEVADISYTVKETEDGYAISGTLKLKKKGKANICIEFPETENVCAAKYNVSLDVTKNVISGDVNGDGEVDIKDSALIKRHLAGWKVDMDMAAADVNGDGEVNIKDSALIKRTLAGW